MKERIIWGAIALAIFLPFLYFGGLPFQLLIGILAMIGVSEMLKMRRLEIFSFEGVLAMLAAFVLTVPLDNYLGFLPVDASFSAYSILVLLILAGTVLNSSRYSFEEAAFPIAASLYVGIGFQNLINARIAGFDKVLLALFIVWATDSGAYYNKTFCCIESFCFFTKPTTVNRTSHVLTNECRLHNFTNIIWIFHELNIFLV